MSLTAAAHGGFVHPRRIRVLADRAARLLPRQAHVLDVGCGDGQLAAALIGLRPDVRIEGIDVAVRSSTAIPISAFDGRVIPKPADSVDVVTLFDVLHHADDPAGLLREAQRIARSCVVIKDHICDSSWAHAILRFMDDVGNRRYGVSLPHNYWSSQQWTAAIERFGFERDVWEVGGLGLYPWPASAVFGSRLHVLACLRVSKS